MLIIKMTAFFVFSLSIDFSSSSSNNSNSIYSNFGFCFKKQNLLSCRKVHFN